jgi:hypothetical protein
LVANPDQPNSISQRVDIQLICLFAKTLFYSCPITQQTVDLIYQPFERGYMVGRRDTRIVYVFYLDKATWEQFEDTWEGEPIYPSMPEDGSIPCASGLRPYGSLGKVWWTHHPIAYARLGCGTAVETHYNALWEEHRSWTANNAPAIMNAFHWPNGSYITLDLHGNWSLLN